QYRLTPEDAGHRIKVVVEPKGNVAGSKAGAAQPSEPVEVTLKAAASLTGPAEVNGNVGETQQLSVGGGNGGALTFSS
ncbi:hypothetical protein, partial [Enterobacter bugandensis]|uniref:hypothetical protein n=1 Tax=Enterobacter bugandensis TaxID=881260 RepID=UPI002FD36CB6